MEELQKDVATLKERFQDIDRRLTAREEADKRQDDDIRQLFIAQAETKTLVATILDSIKGLDAKITTYFATASSLAQSKSDSAATDLAATATKGQTDIAAKALEFAKYAIGATVGAVLIYLFKGR